jgi:hypothetical protein
MHLELFLVMVLISCAPVVGVLISFPSWSSRSLPQRGVCWICYPLQGSCCGANDLFSHLTEVAWVPTLWLGCRDSPASTGSLCTVGGRSPSTNRVVDFHLAEELGFQLLDRRAVALLQGGTVWRAGLLHTLGFCCCLQSRMLYFSSPKWGIWSSCFLIMWRGLSCCQGQWGVLGLHALWGSKPPGASRIARLGAWGSLGCVAAGSWH